MTENEFQFSRLNLQKGDYLVIKVDITQLTDDQIQERLSSVREDPFVKYVEEQGNPVFITYSGINMNVLRMQENDKLIAYVNVSDLPEQTEIKYIDYIRHKLVDHVGEDRLIVMPVRNNSPVLQIKSEENNEY